MDEIIVAVDIGTSKVSTVIGRADSSGHMEILGRGMDYCSGVKKGIIIDIDKTAGSIRNSVRQAEGMANLKAVSAYFNIVGTHVKVLHNKCSLNIAGENREITKNDVDKLLYTAGNIDIDEDTQIIDVIPRQFIIDGYDEIIDPVGMVGVKLEVEADIITGKITSVQNIIKSAERAGLEADGIVVEALGSAEVFLTPDEKDIGVIMIDVGAGITDISVFKKKKLIFYDSIPVGGDHITNDISIATKTSYPEAERVKKQYQLALTSLIKNDQEIQVIDINDGKKKDVMISEVVEVIEARVQEIFYLCREMLENNGINGGYEGGIILTGAGISYLDGSRQIAEEIFGVPVRTATIRNLGIPKIEYAAAVGMLRFLSGRKKCSGAKTEVRIQKVKKENKEGGFLKKILLLLKKLF